MSPRRTALKNHPESTPKADVWAAPSASRSAPTERHGRGRADAVAFPSRRSRPTPVDKGRSPLSDSLVIDGNASSDYTKCIAPGRVLRRTEHGSPAFHPGETDPVRTFDGMAASCIHGRNIETSGAAGVAQAGRPDVRLLRHSPARSDDSPPGLTWSGHGRAQPPGTPALDTERDQAGSTNMSSARSPSRPTGLKAARSVTPSSSRTSLRFPRCAGVAD